MKITEDEALTFMIFKPILEMIQFLYSKYKANLDFKSFDFLQYRNLI